MTSPKVLFTPKELAAAIGASESSLRRWVDSGDIRMSRTAGGHRRIPIAEAIQFIRKIGATVVRPDILGLNELRRESSGLLGLSDDERLFESLRSSERGVARGLILSWYLEGRSLAALFDGPVRSALYRLGELWKHDERAILVEHRATEMCIEAIATIRGMMPAVDEHAPLALGAAPAGDPYLLPTMMASAVMFEAGFREINFGANTPVELLADEATQRGAQLVWLSISAQPEPRALGASLKKLAKALARHQIKLVLGGRYHAEFVPRDLPNVSVIGSMGELAEFAKGIKGETSAHTK